jgi:hypothetical protein
MAEIWHVECFIPPDPPHALSPSARLELLEWADVGFCFRDRDLRH